MLFPNFYVSSVDLTMVSFYTFPHEFIASGRLGCSNSQEFTLRDPAQAVFHWRVPPICTSQLDSVQYFAVSCTQGIREYIEGTKPKILVAAPVCFPAQSTARSSIWEDNGTDLEAY
jgi:hypothetical protein